MDLRVRVNFVDDVRGKFWAQSRPLRSGQSVKFLFLKPSTFVQISVHFVKTSLDCSKTAY